MSAETFIQDFTHDEFPKKKKYSYQTPFNLDKKFKTGDKFYSVYHIL